MINKFKKIPIGGKVAIILIILTIISAGSYYFLFSKNTKSPVDIKEDGKDEIVEEKKLKIINEDSTSRPLAIMINNHNQARPYHSGLQDAYIVYEAIVEGGITRMMAVFKDQSTEIIGSVRSSRHYFLDYALENDAIYVHFGWSPQAQSDISTLGVNNINGLYDTCFWRNSALPIDYEHKAFTSIEKIKTVIASRKYRTETNSKVLLEYEVDEININSSEDSIVANNISVPYSSNYMVGSYTYDSSRKVYLRYANGIAHTDYVTKEQYNFKNIIVINVANSSIDSYGRQTLSNIGTGNGYFITNGYARPITWEKASRTGQTAYKYLDGTEIKVNDGNTFIQIQPTTQTTSITE